MKTQDKQKELLSKFYKYLCEIAVIDDEYREDADMDFYLMNFYESLALGKQKPLAKNKQFIKSCTNCKYKETLRNCHNCNENLSRWRSQL